MELNEFVEEFNGSPVDAEEMAELIKRHITNGPLRDAARKFLDAKDDFEEALCVNGIELG